MKFLKDSSTRIGMALLGVVIAVLVLAPFAGPSLKAQTALYNSYGFLKTGVLLLSDTAPTITSAGTGPAMVSSNGAATFRVNVGTGGTATTIVMAMPTATTGWNCTGSNITAAAANRNPTGVLLEQSSTTTAVTMQYQTVATGVALAFVASDQVLINCDAF